MPTLTAAEIELAAVKLYIKVADTTEDTLIYALIASAKKYILQQTGKTLCTIVPVAPATATTAGLFTDELATMCMKLLVGHWYENRQPEITGRTTQTVPHTVDALIKHIAQCGEYA